MPSARVLEELEEKVRRAEEASALLTRVVKLKAEGRSYEEIASALGYRKRQVKRWFALLSQMGKGKRHG